jgi:hypothetical protein
LLVAFVTLKTGLLAAGSAPDLDAFWDNWEALYECNGSIGDFFGYWEAHGQCDFTGEADPAGLGNEFCLGAWNACIDDCESTDYAKWLAEQNCDDPNDPEPEAECFSECYITFASANTCSEIPIEGGPIDADCECGHLFWCES